MHRLSGAMGRVLHKRSSSDALSDTAQKHETNCKLFLNQDELSDERIRERLTQLSASQRSRLSRHVSAAKQLAEDAKRVQRLYEQFAFKEHLLNSDQQQRVHKILQKSNEPHWEKLSKKAKVFQSDCFETETNSFDFMQSRRYQARFMRLQAAASKDVRVALKLKKVQWLRSSTFPKIYFGFDKIAQQNGMSAEEIQESKRYLLNSLYKAIELEEKGGSYGALFIS